MKIFYDYQAFSIQKYGGVSRLFSELIRIYKSDPSMDCYLSSKFSSNEYLRDIDLKVFSQDIFKSKIGKKLPLLINHLSTIGDLITRDYDIFHPSYYSPYFLQFLGSKPFVLTVHDLTHELLSEYFPQNDKTSSNKKILIPKANKIIAVSENTKKDILNLYAFDENNIEVIYHGSSLKPYEGREKIFNLPERYILYQGVRGGYKNFNKFLSATSPLLVADSGLYLVCSGSTDFTKEEYELIKLLDLEKKVLHFDYIGNEELAYFYQNCLAFVYPSLYEGFGILLLEAMSCGAPMVISNRSSFPEIALDCAMYFDPTSEESIRNSIEEVINNSELRKDLVRKADKRVRDFSWEETARKTKLLYDKVLLE